jgi:hypothetical protein
MGVFKRMIYVVNGEEHIMSVFDTQLLIQREVVFSCYCINRDLRAKLCFCNGELYYYYDKETIGVYSNENLSFKKMLHLDLQRKEHVEFLGVDSFNRLFVINRKSCE